jgi:iron complex outermembrane recepter protein
MTRTYRRILRSPCFVLSLAIPIAGPLWADDATSNGTSSTASSTTAATESTTASSTDASTAADADSSSSTSTGTLTLNQIVVTAQRRSENIYNVPISMAAYSNSDLLQRNITSLDGIASQTPGINYRDFGATSFIAIDGITQNAGGSVAGIGPNTVAIYIDDVPLQTRYETAAVSSANPLVFDIDHIEVLRGPQGTLFGASAEGGAIRLITPTPSLTQYSGYATGGFSDILGGGGQGSQFGVAYGGPIVPGTLGFRVSAWTQHTPGYVNNESAIFGGVDQSNANSSNSYVLQGAVLWKASDMFSAQFRMYYQKLDENSIGLFQPPTSANTIGAGDPGNGDFVSTRALLQPSSDDITAPSLTLNFDFGWSQLKILSSYLNRYSPRDYDYTAVLPPALGFPIPTSMDYAEPTVVGTGQNNSTQEVRLQSPDRGQDLTWIVGAYYAVLSQHDWETVSAPGFPAEVLQYTGETILQDLGENLVNGDGSTNDTYISDQYMRDEDKAVYAHAQYKFLTHFAVLAGVRYERDAASLYTASNGPLAGGPSNASAPSTSSKTVPQFGVNWTPNDQNLIYASAGEGFRAGGGNVPITLNSSGCQDELARLGRPTGYNGDNLWSYTLGDKSRLQDGRLLLDGSVYHINWDNIISAIQLPLCATHIAYNLGDAKSDGFDVSVNMLATANWRVGLSLGYTDARYTSTTAIFGGVVSRSGDAISDISPWNVMAQVQYQHQLTDDADWYWYLQNQYNSRNNRVTPAEDPNTESYDAGVTPNPAYDVLLTRVGLMFANGIDVAFYVDNLLNQHPLLNWDKDLIDITSGAYTIQPRTIGATFTYHVQ